MKRFVRVLLVFSLFFCFLVNVNASTVLSLDVAPQYNTKINNKKLYVTVYDNSGIKDTNIKMYKVDKNKKVVSTISFNSINSTKKGTAGIIQYECVVGSNYLNDSTNYFYISITDNSGLKNDSYFRVVKKKDGGYSRYFAPKISTLKTSSTAVSFTSTDSGTIKSFVVKDLNANKNVKTYSNKKKSLSDSIKLSNLTLHNGAYYFEMYSEDEDGNTARRTNKITVTTFSDSFEKVEETKTDNSQVMKVLLVGNSYTYYNDYGAILAELAKKQGRKMIVVSAVHGGRDAYCIGNDGYNISIYYWDNRGSSTSLKKLDKKNGKISLVNFKSDSEKNTVQDYDLKLDKAINYDWGNLGRAGKWDYVFLQNHYKGEMASLLNKNFNKNGISVLKYCKMDGGERKKDGTVNCKGKSDCRKRYEKNDTDQQYQDYTNESNELIYKKVKNGLSSKSRFVIIRTFAFDWPSHTSDKNYMRVSANHFGFSFIDTRKLSQVILGSTDKKARKNNFTIKDPSEHPSPRGAYLMATAAYAKMFGRSELASSENATNYIKLYNKDNATFRGVVKNALFSWGSNGKTAEEGAMTVDAKYARKIQSTVYECYNDFIKVCTNNKCSSDAVTNSKCKVG